MRLIGWTLVGAAVLGLAVPALAQRKPPYFASISADKARMRTGPGRNYPSSWLYQRADLPIKVVDVYGEWRKVEDPDGTQGWMLVNLLSDTRTGMVRDANAELRAAPNGGARVNWRAAPGVVGRISKCADGWCWFDVRGRGGYVEQSRFWGTDPGEVIR
ncbi:MAG: hypothetical protein EOP59_12390 [Sphingomonadales bacterium]|nr:MAG: hypothetical protein EOP59_12390 [Sphingomonadales bacterium]